MRKADYAALADIIRKFLADDSEASRHMLARGAIVCLAHCFAERASVDRDAFLKACGID